MACLREDGKMLSDSEKFTMLVMGMSKESRQDFRRKVGMASRVQVALEDCMMAAHTSSLVASGKLDRVGGGGFGVGSGKGVWVVWNDADNLAILPLKKSRNLEAKAEVAADGGRVLGEVRESSESKQAHSFLGWCVQFEISVWK
jgi:hypothetical protein